MAKMNCWEYKHCGREIGGVRSEELGVCPAALEARCAGVNGGENGGRACWAIAGTLCGGNIQGSFAAKYGNCLLCDFYHSIIRDEANQFEGTKTILDLLH